MSKLNGWKRIGIVASVAWILVAGYHTLSVESDRDLKVASLMNRSCLSEFNEHKDEAVYEKCLKVGYDFDMGMLPVEREDAAIVAFVPVPFAWGAAYLLLFLARWIRKGFV